MVSVILVAILCFLSLGARVNTQLDNTANEFFIGFPGNSRDPPYNLTLGITTSEPDSVDFTITANGFSYDGVATRYDTTQVDIPASFEVLSNGFDDRKKGIHVKAEGDKKIGVYGSSERATGTSGDSFLALPSNISGANEYIIVGYPPHVNSANRPSEVLIVASEDKTVVTLPEATIALNRLETYQITENGTDLTGMIIKSNKPVSVFSAVACAEVPVGRGTCDHIVEQLPPTATWGVTFFIASLLGRDTGERLRIVSSQTGSTQVVVVCTNLDKPKTFLLEYQGDWIEIEIGPESYCSVQSFAPVIVTQYAKGGMRGFGDPFMMIVPSVEQYNNDYVLTALDGFTNFFSIYVAKEDFQQRSILLNNYTLDDRFWVQVPCTFDQNEEVCGYIARVNVNSGTHNLYHEDSQAQIGVSVYGFKNRSSYGHPGGLRLSPLDNDVPSISLDTSMSPISAMEGTTVDVCVNISGLAHEPVFVTFATFPVGENGATEGLDYPDDLTAIVPPGMTRSCVSILLTDDDIIEGLQTFNVVVDSTSPNLPSGNSTLQLVIEDNDMLKLGFQESEYSFPEASGVNFSICVESIGQIETSVSFILTVKSLTSILRDEPRTVHLGGIHILGAEAKPMNPLTDKMLCINITNDDDGLKEGTQVQILRLETNDSLVSLGRGQALLIEEANGFCTLSISRLGPSVNESAGSVELCVALDQLPIQDIVSAHPENADYIPIDTIFEWHQDSTLEQCTDIPIVNDLLLEETEFFFVDVFGEDVTLTTMVSIIDDDSILVDFRKSLFVTDESTEVISSCVYICNGELQRSVTLSLHVLNGSASSSDDFSVDSFHYEFKFTSENSDHDLCVNISIVDDSIFESVEYFGLSLSSLDSSVEFKQETAQIAIFDNDCVNISLSQESYTVEEATGSVQICALLAGELETTVNAMIFTVPGDAFDVADFSNDGPPGSQLIEFSEPGEQCVNITIAMDEVLENTEFFSVILGSRNERVKVIQRIARVYIIDIGSVTIGFSQVTYSVSEEDGNGSGSILEVCVEVQGTVSIDRTVVISMSSADGSAVGGLDYDEYLQSEMVIVLTFETDMHGKQKRRTANPQQECTSVTILSDSVIENDEDFQLLLTTDDAGIILLPSNTTVVIVDNDYANVTIEQEEYVVAEEGGNVTVCVILTGGELERDILVFISSIDDSAIDSEDYEADSEDYEVIQSFSLDFEAGSPINTTVCVVFPILDNDVVEDDEQFFVSLSTYDTVNFEPVGIASVTITDTDVITVKLTETSYCANEADVFAEIGVEIVSGTLATDVYVTVFTSNQPGDTASPGDDYLELSDMLLIPSGSMIGDVVYFNISIVNDMVVEELTESFTISLNSTSRVIVSEPSSTEVKIMEDLTDSVSVGFVSANNEVTEGDDGTVCVQITGELAREVMITVTGISGTAEGYSVEHDFPQSTMIAFTMSPDMYCLEFSTTQDEVYEDDETFTGHITTTDSQVVLNVVNTTVKILDDDKVGFSLSVDESVCEGAGIVLACVQLETDIEMDAEATIETTDGIAQDPDDYIAISVPFIFSAPLPASALFCIPVRIIDDSVLEPCENFILSVTSSSARSCIVGDDFVSVVINDDEDITSDLLLFNNSPQISGTNLTANFTLSGCAQVLCEVKSRTRQVDCSPAVGSFEGHWFAPSVTGRNTLQNMAITVQPYCTGQAVPDFEDRPFRTDNRQCSQHFTNQQYSVDSASGNVTVEWEGTGPNETVQVGVFTCRMDGGTCFPCTSPTVLPGLALTPGIYTLNVFPVGIEGCTRMVGRSLLISV